MIDTHCHIDLYDKPEKILQECEKNGTSVIAMTNLPSHFEQGFPFFQKSTRCRIALGLHPLYAHSHNTEFNIFLKNIDKTSFIGEVGLDFSKEGIKTKEIQLDSFEKLLRAISTKKKILSIHSRGAEKEIIDLLVKYNIKNVIFHWYSGPKTLLNNILDLEYYLSINPYMTTSSKGQSIISQLPISNILTESDGPFVQHNNKTIYPWDIKIVIDYFAKTRGKSIMDVEKQIQSNFYNLIDKIR
ncbi:TatD family hydrolase [Aquirufa ecclesiirivi]|nr:TatD family hydrolase [Aquirufa ecclesiirivi]